MKSKITSHLVLAGLLAWGCVSFFVMAGDPVEPMSDTRFLVTKVLAMLSLAACYLVARFLFRRGLVGIDILAGKKQKED